MKTKQETFDIVAAHLMKQNRRAGKYCQDLNGLSVFKCMYRGENGSKCAIGCLISDEEYSRCYDDDILTISLNDIYDDLKSLQEHDLSFLILLQRLHDRNKPEDQISWKTALTVFARENNLSFDISLN